jgi:hypothetical protein
MLNRRHFLGGACASLWLSDARAAAVPVSDGARLAFSVLREGREIGAHVLTFARNGDTSTIQVAIDLVVKLGPVPLYRYEHRATEIWNGANFASIDATTTDNGKSMAVKAKRLAKAVSVESTIQGNYEAPANALPSTHWNRRMLDGPFFNTQWGDLMSNAVTPRGATTVETGSGRKINVRRFEIVGHMTLETWYDEQMTWSGLQFKGQDGSQIVYKRQD